MFRPVRKREDVFLPDGTYRALEQRLFNNPDTKDIRTVVAWAFDPRTDLGPYIGLGKKLAS